MGERTGKIRFRQDRNKWEIDIHLDGIRIKRLLPTKSAATAKLAELRRVKGVVESNLNLPFNIPKKQHLISFNQMLGKYLTFHEKTRTKKTFARELSIVTCHLGPYFKDAELSQITLEHIDRYKSQRLEDGIAPATLRKELFVLSAILSMAVKYGYLEHNIMRDADRVRIPDRDPLFLTPDQVRKFLNSSSEEFRPLAMVYLYCGLRRDEAFDITWDDVDFKSGILTIRAATAKSKRTRTIPIHPELREELLMQKNRHPETQYVFPGMYGKRRVTCQKAFRIAISRAGLNSKLRLHDLRHTWASNCIASGIDPITVKEWGGWSSIKLLDIYGHPDRRKDREKIERLDYFGPQNVPKNNEDASKGA